MPLSLAIAAALLALTPAPEGAVASSRVGDVLTQLEHTAPGARRMLVDDAQGRLSLRGDAVILKRPLSGAGDLVFSVREVQGGASRVSKLVLHVANPPGGTPLAAAHLASVASFDEAFDALPDLYAADHRKGRWKTNFWFGDQAGDTSRTLGAVNQSSNKEAEIYVDKAYKGMGLQPFSVHDGLLSITAAPTPAGVRGRLSDLAYTSGLLTSEPSFSFVTGYAVVRALLPAGRGLWPAPLWLLPTPTRDAHGDPHVPGSQEIDGVEVLMHDPAKVFMTLHDPTGGQKAVQLNPDSASAWHSYGVLRRPDRVEWYIDDRLAYSLPAPADMRALPMYLLLDLAVGGPGSWPGPPDGATTFPAAMKLDYVRVYPLAGSPR